MITGPEIIIGIGVLYGLIAIYFMFGGDAPFGVDKKDDDASQEHWPFIGEKLVSDAPFIEKPVPEYPVWMKKEAKVIGR